MPREALPCGQADLLSLMTGFEFPEELPSTCMWGGDFNGQRLWPVTGTWKKVLRQEKKPDQHFLPSWHATVDSLSPSEQLTLVINRWGLESFQFALGMLNNMYPILVNSSTLFCTTFQRVQWEISIVLITDSKVGNHQLWMNTFCLTKRPRQNTAYRFACDTDIAG